MQWQAARLDHYGNPLRGDLLYVNIGTEEIPRWGKALTSKGHEVKCGRTKGIANRQLRHYVEVYRGLEVAWGWGLLGIAPPSPDMGWCKAQIHTTVKTTRKVA